ncbi:2-C-methyl-D-erythritol 4-phosphate cytidylyltransferase/2-C-methyl-D-erythritol 2,4-cyclodiphosphate synthase [Cryobacterium sp. CAN_C3]|uniref:2-C-methyl-D-erythritol 2,4-cyclodiphosphate synthase n=1 Tax=unclassified Cryobacterium TaxID=2649013 RepID=UPI0018CBC789|nr:2-C-methyl-D-erythritol 2,4-cyclodiphosphate synthase [Cryobacterium sp. CAN_C3]MEC5155034.1 2-C-methyl-D-erythritol 4-phosphate cytidylyltransferase/2-C-methyl-D-erythritol 2,4-cyclodiphosphate synthase [Cryobacterium sp. CAN_C3]
MTVPLALPAAHLPGARAEPVSGTAAAAATVAVIVVAAGSGTRLGHAEPKAFVLLDMRSLLDHALDSIFGMTEPVQTIVVAPSDRVADARAIAEQAANRHGALASSNSVGPGPTATHPPATDTASTSTAAGLVRTVTIVAGGRTRQDSVDRGMSALLPSVDIVLVHDAARALTPAALCDDVVAAVRATGYGIIPGLPVVDTIKRVAGSGAILGTVDRSELSAVQTPQGFPRAMLEAARAWAVQNGRFEALTDDAALVADAGHPVRVIPGDPLAFKITTPEDLERADLILHAAAAASQPPLLPRIGTGLDVHAFATEDDKTDTSELWLAGLYWPGERGLSGHSDGDVAAHAICDALLGAAGLGDIGSVFGTADPRFSGAHGDVFLTETVRLVYAAGYLVGNVSVQIIGNRPRFTPRRAEAERLLAGILSAPVNIAATTTDALGFTGRGEGVAATATALVYPAPRPGQPTAPSRTPEPGMTPDLNWEV